MFLYNEYYHENANNYRVQHSLLEKKGEKDNDFKLAYASKVDGVTDMASKVSLSKLIEYFELRRFSQDIRSFNYYLGKIEILDNIVND